MQLVSVLTSAAVLLFFLLVQRLSRRWQQYGAAQRLGCKPPNKYPRQLPWGLDLYRARASGVKEGRYNRTNMDLFVRYGSTYEERLLGTRYINTIEPENMRTMLAINHADYCKNVTRKKAVLPFLGPGIFSEEGPMWKRSRDLIKPLFKLAELGDVNRFKKHVDMMFSMIPRDGSTIDLAPLLQKLFLDSSTEFIFGESIGSLNDKTGEADKFQKAFSEALIGAGKRGNLGLGKLNFLFMTEDKKWLESCSQVHVFIDRHVADAIQKASKQEHNPDLQPRQQHYILANEMAKEIKDPVRLRSELLNVFSPARDGTSVMVSNALFYLARHPKIWAELRQQALELGDRPLTFELLKSLSLFKYTLQEAIRLQGPSGKVQREALRDTVLPKGGGKDGAFPVFVRKGSVVAANNFPIYHNPEIWGRDVEEFRPHRFDGKVFGWEFVPFLGGPRICPAQQQVYTQGIYLLVRLVREFETMENRDPCIEYVEEIKMLCQSRNGVKVALQIPKGQ